jgi:mono/diheme cytochrome c family protein
MRDLKLDNMVPAIILAAVVSIRIVAGVVWAGPQPAPEPTYAWKDGAEVYTKLCALCHESKIGPTIKGRGLDPQLISYTVRHGNRAMPAFREAEIDDESLAKVAEYVSKQ